MLYAPGPAEVIRHGADGFLLGKYSAEAVVKLLESLSPEKLTGLSQAAFARHQDYSMEQYLTALETIAADTALTFPGKNRVRAFPKIRATEVLVNQDVITFLMRRFRVRETLLAWRFVLVEQVLPWRIVKVLRGTKAKLKGGRG